MAEYRFRLEYPAGQTRAKIASPDIDEWAAWADVTVSEADEPETFGLVAMAVETVRQLHPNGLLRWQAPTLPGDSFVVMVADAP